MDFNDLFLELPDHLKVTANSVRDIILQTDPRIEEDIYEGKKIKIALYCIGKTSVVIAGITHWKDHIRLFIHYFDKIKTTPFLLIGDGEVAKHITFHTLQDVDQDKIISIINQQITYLHTIKKL